MKISRRVLTGIMAGTLMISVAACGLAEWKEETKGSKVIRREWVDAEGNASLAPAGYAVVTLSYSGTTVTEKYFDLEGNPTRAVGGYYGRMLTYGNRHRLEEVIFLDENGKKTECTAGYARVKTVYTSAGGVTTTSYYDLANDLVKVPSLGYAQVKNDYRGTRLTKTTYLDENRNPVDTPLGYATMIQSVNKSNWVVGIRFEHADGSPAACAEGWASMKRELDSKGREVSVKYYDLSGRMTDRGLSYAYENKKWESNLICVITRFDLNNQQIAIGAGYWGLRRQMNKEEQVIRETCLDESGAITENAEGIASRKYEYDENGMLAKVTFENDQGHIAANTEGYAGYRETRDAEGFVLSRTLLGKDGKPVNSAAGYSEIRYQYDANRQISRTEYYDVNGVLVKSE